MAAAVVAAAASLGNAAHARDCPAVCWIDIRVVDDGAGGRKLDIEDNGNAKMPSKFRWVAIIWTVKTDGYELRSDSIRPHTGRPVPGKETTSRGMWDRQIVQANASRWDQFYAWNLNSDPVTMYYDVKVYPIGEDTPIVADPAIINDP
jgi:hypothetical protein